jgi:hypothetical protein
MLRKMLFVISLLATLLVPATISYSTNIKFVKTYSSECPGSLFENT